MKPTHFLASALAVVAIAGCNSNSGDAATGAPAQLEQIAPPKGGDWTQVVNPSPQGGFVMGNPNAAVKLIEYGSMTCSHCAEFDETGATPLMNNYVKSGQVSWEYRNYVRDGLDLTASLIARCNGAKGFFPLARAMFKDQSKWMGKVQAAPEAQLQQLQSLPPNQQFLAMAKLVGFQEWAAMRGVPLAKSNQCLADQNSVNQLIQMTSDVATEHPTFPGTPSFVINGELAEKTSTWKALEPVLRKALGS
ncbi:MAG TPA: thioredoxin domain-containing protein [Sphingomicrobium sp.]